jgi:hypothetical protein
MRGRPPAEPPRDGNRLTAADRFAPRHSRAVRGADGRAEAELLIRVGTPGTGDGDEGRHPPAAPARNVAPPATRRRLDAVSRALAEHKVLALLFYNPAAADDQAVRQELAAVPARGPTVFKLAVPLNELTRYSVVTSQVPVNVAPTLVLIDRRRQASTIVGFADRFEIEQRVLDALG